MTYAQEQGLDTLEEQPDLVELCFSDDFTLELVGGGTITNGI